MLSHLPPEVQVALVTGILAVLSAVLVEMVRSRRSHDRVLAQVTPNGGSSLADAVHRIEDDVREIRVEQRELRKELVSHGERLARVEARQEGLAARELR